MVVLHPTVRTVLNAWLEVRLKRSTVSDDLVVSRRGAAPSTSAVRMEFHKLLRAFGLEAALGGKTPRIHDLRHSFALRMFALERLGGNSMAALLFCGRAPPHKLTMRTPEIGHPPCQKSQRNLRYLLQHMPWFCLP